MHPQEKWRSELETAPSLHFEAIAFLIITYVCRRESKIDNASRAGIKNMHLLSCKSRETTFSANKEADIDGEGDRVAWHGANEEIRFIHRPRENKRPQRKWQRRRSLMTSAPRWPPLAQWPPSFVSSSTHACMYSFLASRTF